MELSKKERLAFIYQLRALEALYPDEAAEMANHRTALENGYALHYDWMTEQLSDGLSEEECREVLDVLDMYRAITFSLSKLVDDDPLRSHHSAKFRGFDGNNEGSRRSYVRYFIIDLERYEELKDGDYPSFNSHTPMIDRYKRMLEAWRPYRSNFELSRPQISSILEA